MREAAHAFRAASRRVGLVPTMGALHGGHRSLIRAAGSSCGAVVVSIFVNPTQFGPNEDLAEYPRSPERDCEMLEAEGVDLLFAPGAREMYPTLQAAWVTVEGLSGKLDGRSRPGHFRGVTTVVAKLFNIIQPDAAFFGQKDAAQLAIIRRMVRDLNFDIEIVACPIVREPDGLAMSSRNAYLTKAERKQALVLHRSLERIEQMVRMGEIDSRKLISAGREKMGEEKSVRLDYFEIVDPETLDPVKEVSNTTLVAVAAYIGTTRLIDNVLLGKNF